MKRVVNLVSSILKKEMAQKKIHLTYLKIINKGDLVFDVGSNIGDKTKIFLDLGANVVSIEPQEACYKILKRRYGNRVLNYLLGYNDRIILLNKGLNEEEGYKQLNICETSVLSTMSDKWMKESRFSNAHQWSKTQLVPVTTLDSLIIKYGLPKFCKIDVEGFEYPVIKGLKQPIPFISFEFSKELFVETEKCINYLLTLGNPIFNVSIGESGEFIFTEWVKSNDVIEYIHTSSDCLLWGDIYVQFS